MIRPGRIFKSNRQTSQLVHRFTREKLDVEADLFKLREEKSDRVDRSHIGGIPQDLQEIF